jgi:hypothetical protein
MTPTTLASTATTAKLARRRSGTGRLPVVYSDWMQAAGSTAAVNDRARRHEIEENEKSYDRYNGHRDPRPAR